MSHAASIRSPIAVRGGWWLALSFLCLLGLSCHGKVDESPPPSPPLVPLDEADFLPELTHALCDGVEPCCQLMHQPPASDCTAALQSTLFVTSMQALRQKGQAYDPLAARRCVEESKTTAAQQTAACQQGKSVNSVPWSDVPDSCWQGVYQGLAPGQPCQPTLNECFAHEPGQEGHCETNIGCVQDVYNQEGDPCSYSSDEVTQAVSLHCDDRQALHCDNDRKCRRLLPEGSPCELVDEFTSYCETPLDCVQGTCKPPTLQAGDTCDAFTHRCAPGLACVAQTPASSTCLPARDDGNTCDDHKDCQSGFCYMHTCTPPALQFLGACSIEP